MEKNNRKCIVCGKEYRYCPICNHWEELKEWKNDFCSSDCKDLYFAVTGYLYGGVSKEDTRNIINRIDYSQKNLSDGVMKVISEVNKVNKKVIKNLKNDAKDN